MYYWKFAGVSPRDCKDSSDMLHEAEEAVTEMRDCLTSV